MDQESSPPANNPKHVQEAFPEFLSIEELVEQVAIARRQALAARANVLPQNAGTTPERSRLGGAFGGALSRRIEETDTAVRYASTNDHDILLLTPTNLNRELFFASGGLVYRGVLLTANEMGAVTFSPVALTQRVGANVLKHTTQRPATTRHQRSQEVITKALADRATAAAQVQTELAVDSDVFRTLLMKMKSPGYAHMKGYEMDALMAHAEGNFVDMIAAILDNHKLSTERVSSMTAALDYLLGNDDYRKTFSYWRHMSQIGLNWTNAKVDIFTNIQQLIVDEQQARK